MTINLGKFKCFSIGNPAERNAYLSFVTEDGQSYRVDFSSKQLLSLIRYQASKIEDHWPTEVHRL